MDAKAGKGGSKAILVYDGACPLCTRAADWVRRNARPDVVELFPCQSEERTARFPEISEAACMEAMQLVLPDGSIRSGERALPELFRLMRRWRWLAWLFSVPGIAWLSPFAYRWVARHRQALSVIVARKGFPDGEARRPAENSDQE